jgi:large subunit ribosomal protein L33
METFCLKIIPDRRGDGFWSWCNSPAFVILTPVMAKKGARQLFGLICSVCKKQNYITEKNKTNTEAKLALNKYCSRCRRATEHKETQKLK